jgi:hypothetical protein
MRKDNKRNFELMNQLGKGVATYVGHWPRQAALKAANDVEDIFRHSSVDQDGFRIICLREKGTKRVHVFKVKSVMVPKPANAPAWLPNKIRKAIVYKEGIRHLDKI